MPQHREATSKDEWVKARVALLAKEKEYTRLGDELAAARRELPWVPVEKAYAFETADGTKTLAELFGTRKQLLVYHFMFGPDWKVGCKSCSFWADHFAATLPHLAARDVQLVCVSRGPLGKLQAFATRMGWTHPWASSAESDFNHDFGVSFAADQEDARYNFAPKKGSSDELPGLSAFAKRDDGRVFHTYSTYGRGLDTFNATYRLLDVAPKGRNEGELPFPMDWVRLHDEYDG
jgi:predicted dithiol-disulfide oxidoreductase (DUF899 family)